MAEPFVADGTVVAFVLDMLLRLARLDVTKRNAVAIVDDNAYLNRE